jgi:hypothetical protein
MAMLDLAIGKPLPEAPTFRAQAQARSFWQRSDLCRWDFVSPTGAAGSMSATSQLDAKGWFILPRHEREPDDRYLRRLNQAMPRRFVRQIVNRYNDHVCRQEIQRPITEGAYGDILADANGAGIGLSDLMRLALRKAQVDGVSYLLADMSSPAPWANKAQEQEANRRPIVRLIGADQVVWWRDYEGQPVEAVVLMTDADGAAFGWYVSTTEAGRIDFKQDERGTRTVVAFDFKRHDYDGCPLVRLCPEWDGGDHGGDDSMAAPLAECQKRIINVDSWLLEELQGATFTMPVLLGVDPNSLTGSDGSKVVVGPGMMLALPSMANGGVPALGRIGADPTQAESLRESLAYEIQQLYRVAGLAPGNPTETGAPESGVAKAFAFNEVESRLTALADAAACAENMAMARLAPLIGGYPGDAIWPKKFDAPDIASELDLTIRMLTAPQMPGVLRAKAVSAFADKAFSFAPEERAELDQQIEALEAERQEAETSPFTTPGAGGTGPGTNPGRMAQE